jgi:hypothetical protein
MGKITIGRADSSEEAVEQKPIEALRQEIKTEYVLDPELKKILDEHEFSIRYIREILGHVDEELDHQSLSIQACKEEDLRIESSVKDLLRIKVRELEERSDELKKVVELAVSSELDKLDKQFRQEIKKLQDRPIPEREIVVKELVQESSFDPSSIYNEINKLKKQGLMAAGLLALGSLIIYLTCGG